MTKSELLGILRQNKETLLQRFGVIELTLFDSFARDQREEDSDVDIIVRFDTPPNLERYFGAQFFLEDLLGRQVDMATYQEITKEIRPYVDREMVHV